ncbi:hypothetical protein D0T53_03165 [Dysgonomonas sp. 216]|uniref:hypothetical protein n=1 Tax=Dysgonomonas sp. 216 TaxID=2302934 RepID=UPI0013D88C28|nr:hypothetical protein [Dysgonomonas sp. 216]NDW17917.1 hypothetical protein [Dysgonomonas sp. 216]
MTNNISISIYTDLIKDSLRINAWNRDECFNINQETDKSFLINYNIIEIIFEGTHGNNDLYNRLLINYNSFLNKYLFSRLTNQFIYLYSVSDKKQKSKIRSYKGVFSRSLNINDYIETEINVEENYTIIAGLAKVTPSNIDYLIGALSYRSNNLIILSDKNLLLHQNVEYITDNIVDQSNGVINYIELCKIYSGSNNIIIREGGDGGDQELSWQFFIEKEKCEEILSYIKLLIDN